MLQDGVMSPDEPKMCVYRAKFHKLLKSLGKKISKEMPSEILLAN